ncbi:SDR family NAD(P)-dependent oxidoreductase [Saccharopolyspora sp. 5N708]|uniref:SDR family NAD(P)-dependent oxidoreductase n=1 Tax=Saccharopolyspora sp. 5N708 TaxID=3457424 RepID=UPI003FD203A4
MNRVVLVTGGTRNIGRATALTLAGAGHDVVVVGRSAVADGFLDELRALGVHATAHACDVSDGEQVRALRDTLAADGLTVDVLVNNASQRPHQPFLEISPDDWRSVLGVTLDGAFHCTQAFLPHMIDRGWGRVINLIGVRAQSGAAGRAHLVAAKNGLIGLTRALAREFGQHGVTVNAISPGTIVTDRDTDPERLTARSDGGALGRLGQPADVAAAIRFLASEEAGYITGQIIGVNGGELMV